MQNEQEENNKMQQVSNKMHIFKVAFLVLLVLDFVELILVGIALYPTFKKLAGYGTLMLCVAGVIVAVIVAVLLFELVAKVFLLRSTSLTFSRSSGHEGYTAIAILLLLVNLGAVLFNLLSAGGEGATLLNQMRLYLQVLASVAEIITVFCYLRTVKRIFASINEEKH